MRRRKASFLRLFQSSETPHRHEKNRPLNFRFWVFCSRRIALHTLKSISYVWNHMVSGWLSILHFFSIKNTPRTTYTLQFDTFFSFHFRKTSPRHKQPPMTNALAAITATSQAGKLCVNVLDHRISDERFYGVVKPAYTAPQQPQKPSHRGSTYDAGMCERSNGG